MGAAESLPPVPSSKIKPCRMEGRLKGNMEEAVMRAPTRGAKVPARSSRASKKAVARQKRPSRFSRESKKAARGARVESKSAVRMKRDGLF